VSAPIFLLEAHRGIPLVSIVVTLRTGAANDLQGREGLARMTARLVRRGTRRLSRTQFDEAIESLGSELALDVGSSTTTFAIQVLSKYAERVVDLLAEMFAEPALDAEEHERLKRESTAELLEMRDADRALAQIALRRALFGDHVYGRSTAGRLSTVASISIDDVRAFHAQHYVRSSLVVGIAGDIDEARAVALATRLGSALPDRPSTVPDIREPKPIVGRRLIFVDKPDRTQSQLAVASLGTWAHDPDHVALSTAVSVLGGTFTSRLMKEVRSKRGWSYSTSARVAIAEQRHAFAMWSFPATKDTAPCLALELDLLSTFVTSGISARELAFIKKYLVRSFAFEVDTAHKRLGQKLDVELLRLPKDYYAAYREHVEAVSLDAANRAIQARLSDSALVIVVVGTASDLAETLRRDIPRIDAMDVVPFDQD